ncbi:uncharacterized protein LOC144152951 [Haemaphysalis longicornis]
MDVSTDTAVVALPPEPNKVASKPEVGDDTAAVETAVRVTSREAASPAGEAVKAPSGDQVSDAALSSPTSQEPLAEAPAPVGEGEGKPDDAKPVADAVKPPADAEVASQTDDDLKDCVDKAAAPAEPDAPRMRPFVFSVGPGLV